MGGEFPDRLSRSAGSSGVEPKPSSGAPPLGWSPPGATPATVPPPPPTTQPAPGAPPTPAPPGQQNGQRQLFISYARRDADVIEKLEADLRRVGSPWRDAQLVGGGKWWNDILDQIESADVFVFAISPDSLDSRACRAERAYALALGKQILPVKVRETNHTRVKTLPPALLTTDIIDYLDTSSSGIALKTAIDSFDRGVPQTEPRPARPPAPIADLSRFTEALEAPELDTAAQEKLVVALEELVGETDVHDTMLLLLERFLKRHDVNFRVHPRLRHLEEEIERTMVFTDLARYQKEQPRRFDELDDDTKRALKTLRIHVGNGKMTPIIGWGMTDSLVGPIRYLLRQLAATYNWPKSQPSDDLALVAQYIRAMNDSAMLLPAVTEGVQEQLRAWNDGVTDPTTDVNQLLTAVWRQRRDNPAEGDLADPHTALAAMPCKIYVTAHPWDLMTEALRATPLPDGTFKDPVVEVCWWKPDEATPYDSPPMPGWPEPSELFDESQEYVPSVERPLVYHIFGRIDHPASLVLCADDYLDFLINVTKAELVPEMLREAIVESAVTLLGFGLQDVSAQVLLRALVDQEGTRKSPYKHLGAHEPAASRGPEYSGYLTKYFGDHEPPIDIFWGRVDEFTAGLAEIIGPST